MNQAICNWSPVLSDELGRCAIEVALEVAQRLADPQILAAAISISSQQTSVPGSVHWDPQSISCGDAGLARAFGYFDQWFAGTGWTLAARRPREIAARSVGSRGVGSVALFGGLSGLGLAR